MCKIRNIFCDVQEKGCFCGCSVCLINDIMKSFSEVVNNLILYIFFNSEKNTIFAPQKRDFACRSS
jgi:hypothetical protein